ncbi:MAG: hypothetical protein U0Q55_21170 [Vicinamibacterales bacterium]
MKGDDVVRRLTAYAKGKPLPNGETLWVPKPGKSVQRDEMLVVSFVRMGGESSPWGVAFGTPDSTPQVLTVPEARTRDDVGGMMATFAPELLEHFLHPQFSKVGREVRRVPRKKLELPVRQIWVPTAAHLEMLHCIAYTYYRTKYGPAERHEVLQQLSRLCGWLFREAKRVGQTVTMVASGVLSEAYTFPADDLRQAHLGFLLAWLQTKGGRAARSAAADAAELESVSTSLDPELERSDLQEYVENFNDARTEQDEAGMAKATRRIHKVLSQELLRRWHLTVTAIDQLENDKRRENAYVGRLIRASQDEHYLQYLRMEQKIEDRDPEDGPVFTPSPETDRHPAAAGSRYFVNASSAELRDLLLAHDDRELQASMVAAGDAIDGVITEIEVEKEGRKTTVTWKVTSDGRLPLRIRDGAPLCPVRWTNRELTVLSISQPDAQTNEFELQVTKGYTLEKPGILRADDKQLLNTRVMLLPVPMDGIQRRKSAAIWNDQGPGNWLTHALPKVKGMDLPDDVAEDMPGLGARS